MVNEIDTSAILADIESSAVAIESKQNPSEIADPGALPDWVMTFTGGVIPVIMDYSMSIAPRPNKVLSFCGALTLAAHMIGRRFIAEDGSASNLYLVALANSGTGKDCPRKVNRELAVDIGMRGTVCDTFKSGAGLEDAVLSKTRILSQYDEFDTLFRAMKKDITGSSEDLAGMMLTFYGDAGSTHYRRQLSKAVNDKSGVPEMCRHPHLTIFGTAIPQQFFDAMSERMMTNGLFARCLVVPASVRSPSSRAAWRAVPNSSLEMIASFAGSTLVDGKFVSPVQVADEKPNEAIVYFDDLARKALDECATEYDTLYDANTHDESLMAIYSRSYEKVVKLALVFAVSENWQAPQIGVQHIERAKALVDYSNAKSLYLAKIYCADNEFHDLCQRIKRYVSKKNTTRRDLVRAMHQPVTKLDEALENLLLGGEIADISGDPKRPIYTSIDALKE